MKAQPTSALPSCLSQQSGSEKQSRQHLGPNIHKTSFRGFTLDQLQSGPMDCTCVSGVSPSGVLLEDICLFSLLRKKSCLHTPRLLCNVKQCVVGMSSWEIHFKNTLLTQTKMQFLSLPWTVLLQTMGQSSCSWLQSHSDNSRISEGLSRTLISHATDAWWLCSEQLTSRASQVPGTRLASVTEGGI